ncbi:hypothetical protein BJV78DRAFT_1158227 [Lactifluus subvellereus]|nr:hypothetical protein BJV78DRAFT_1158227 [Lactifluus subvellereus]
MLGTKEVAFSGGLSSKKVDELRDIAYALALSEVGKKEDLVTVIKSELAAHPELQQNHRFAGLFTVTARGKWRNAPANENAVPSPQPQSPTAGPSTGIIPHNRTKLSDHTSMESGPSQPPQAPTPPGQAWPPQSFGGTLFYNETPRPDFSLKISGYMH